MFYKIENSTIYLFDAYNYKDSLSAMGCRFDKKLKAWKIDWNLDSAEDLNSWFDLSIPFPKVNVDNNFKEYDASVIIPHLYKHQIFSANIGMQNNYFADLSDPGTGKTLVQIELILKRNSYPILIVCPDSIIRPVWVTELVNWFKEWEILVLDKGSLKNKSLLNEWNSSKYKAKIIVINYDSIWRIENEIIDIPFKTMILDESTKIKNHKSKRAKSIIKIGDKKSIEYKAIMTGTVAPNGLLDVFNQVRFVNPVLFGKSYYAFREKYFTHPTEFLWIEKPSAYRMFKERMQHCSVQHHKRDCTDLPPLNHILVPLQMKEHQASMYEQMKQEAIAEISSDNFIVARFMTTKMVKLRQIASGFIYDEFNTGNIISSIKTDMVVELAEQLGKEKIIIFANFIEMQNMLTEELNKSGLGLALNFGHELSMKKNDVLNEFKNGDCRFLVANPKSAGHGLNLQFCSYIIYAEHDFDLETYLQSLQRIERIGQENKMTAYHLEVKKTIESYIWKKLQKKTQIQENIDLSSMKKELMEAL